MSLGLQLVEVEARLGLQLVEASPLVKFEARLEDGARARSLAFPKVVIDVVGDIQYILTD